MSADQHPPPSGPRPLQWAEVEQDPHATLAAARAEHWWAPIAGTDALEVLTDEAVRTLLADDTHLRSDTHAHTDAMMAANPALPPALRQAISGRAAHALLSLDGEPHHRLRALASRAFSPRHVATRRPFLEATAADVAARVASGSDFMQSFAREFPARALTEFTGVPAADRDRAMAWIDTLTVELSPAALSTLAREAGETVLAAHREFAAYTRALVEQRRAAPQDDLISRLASAIGESHDAAVIADLVWDILFAGNDTMRRALGILVWALAEQPQTWEQVAHDPNRAEPVVEEVLRLYSPAPGPVRRVAEPMSHRGETFQPGAVTALSIWSANRDEARWGPQASEFNPDREGPEQHLAFGHGAHFCLGAGLAREELRAALIVLTHAWTDLRVIEPPRMAPVGGVWGPIELRIGFRLRAQ